MGKIWRLTVMAAAVALCAASASTMVQNGSVATTTDRFTGKTTTTLKGMFVQVDESTLLGLSIFASGDQVELMLRGAGQGDWKYLRCHDIALLADGKPVPVGEASHDGDVYATFGDTIQTDEFITAPIAANDFSAIATAWTIEGRLCNDEFKLTDAQVKQVREFARQAGFAPK